MADGPSVLGLVVSKACVVLWSALLFPVDDNTLLVDAFPSHNVGNLKSPQRLCANDPMPTDGFIRNEQI